MGYLDIGLSNSESTANKATAGAGDFGSGAFTVNAGGSKQSIVLYVVIGAVALVVLYWKFIKK